VGGEPQSRGRRDGATEAGPVVLGAAVNFSEGRDPAFAKAVAAAYATAGCEVVHATADPDHHRSVLTVLGEAHALVEGSAAAMAVALARIDLRRHRGVHPRVGAMDVLPFFPVGGTGMLVAEAAARSAARRLAAMGVPVYLYGRSSVPPGRGLAVVRRGGWERLRRLEAARRGADGAPTASPSCSGSADGEPGRADLAGLDAEGRPAWVYAHPTAGAVCVGARGVLLAWNVDLIGVPLDAAKEIAARVREAGGGLPSVRALALRLPRQDRLQVSMTVGDLAAAPPAEVFGAVEAAARRHGGSVARTEVIGMLPDALADRAAARALRICDWSPARVLPLRAALHMASKTADGKQC